MATVSWLRHRGREEASPGKDGTGSERDDAELVAAAQADPEAFSTLYQRYVGPVYRFCYVRLGSAQEAEDATSRVFARALASLRDYRGGAFAVWLFRIAQNVVIDTLRCRRPVQGLDAVVDRGDSAPGPEDEALACAEGEALRQALGQLTAEQRLAVELQLAGWSGPEIAAVLGKSPQAVKMLRFRALQRLRACLSQGAGQDGEVHDGRA